MRSASTLPPGQAALLAFTFTDDAADPSGAPSGADAGVGLGGARARLGEVGGAPAAAPAAAPTAAGGGGSIILAARLGDVAALTRCIAASSGADDVLSATDSHGRALLHIAAGADGASGHVECIRALLNAGADVNAAAGRQQRTALHEAVRRGHANVTALLVEHGARTDALDANLATPLTLAMRGRRGRGDPDLIAALGCRTRPSA